MSNKAHKHAAMIKAKADNIELVVFGKHEKSNEWHEIHYCGDIAFLYEYEYFLCLPQHKEACLYWLNGSDVECNSKYTNGWETCHDINNITWSTSIGLMRDDAKYRIKPRKERRWIAVTPDGHVSDKHFSTKDECCGYVINEYLPSFVADAQYKEIEVEV